MAKYGNPYSEFVICNYPIQCAHTAVNTPRAVGSHFMLRLPGSSRGFGALLKGTSVEVLKVERALYIHCPHLQFLPDLRLKPTTFGLRARLSNYATTAHLTTPPPPHTHTHSCPLKNNVCMMPLTSIMGVA